MIVFPKIFFNAILALDMENDHNYELFSKLLRTRNYKQSKFLII